MLSASGFRVFNFLPDDELTMNNLGSGFGRETQARDGEVSGLTIRRIGWSIALLGLAVPALVRFLTSPLDGTTTVLALLGGLALSWPAILLVLWVTTLPLSMRNRSLRRQFPQSRMILAAETGHDLEPFLAHQDQLSRSRSRLLPLTLVLEPESLKFWQGGWSLTRFAGHLS